MDREVMPRACTESRWQFSENYEETANVATTVVHDRANVMYHLVLEHGPLLMPPTIGTAWAPSEALGGLLVSQE